MKRSDLIRRLKAVEPALRAQGISALYLYGSHARDEARPDSDIDVLVEFDDDGSVDFLRYMAPYVLLEDAFPNHVVGYGTKDNLVPEYRSHIERGTMRIF